MRHQLTNNMNIDKGIGKVSGENHGHNQYRRQRKATAAPPTDLTATEDLLCEVAAVEPRRPGAGAEVERFITLQRFRLSHCELDSVDSGAELRWIGLKLVPQIG